MGQPPGTSSPSAAQNASSWFWRQSRNPGWAAVLAGTVASGTEEDVMASRIPDPGEPGHDQAPKPEAQNDFKGSLHCLSVSWRLEKPTTGILVIVGPEAMKS